MSIEMWVILIWAGIIAFSVLMYVLMDGFDLGVGILFLIAPTDHDRDRMMAAVAPVWDGNQTWLVMGGIGLFSAFPVAYAVILPAVYLPVLAMVIALIFRGVAFEFRAHNEGPARRRWSIAFSLGSILAAFAQGVVLGTFIQGIPVEDGQFAGSALHWLTPFALFVGGGLCAGYALLGATWLIYKTDGPLQAWSREVALVALALVVVFMTGVSVWTPLAQAAIADRWFSWSNLLWLAPIPVLTVVAVAALYFSASRSGEVGPFVWAVILFLLNYGGLAVSLWPMVVPPAITLIDAAAPYESQVFLLIGTVILLPIVLAYTVWSYWIFRGKVGDRAYH